MYKYRVFLNNQKVIKINTDKPLREIVDKILDNLKFISLETVYINSPNNMTTVKFDQIVAFELIEEPLVVESEIKKCISILEYCINGTPSGNLRNRLADINIFLMGEIEVIKALVKAEKEKENV